MKRKKRSRSLDHDVKSRSIRKSRQSTSFGDSNPLRTWAGNCHIGLGYNHLVVKQWCIQKQDFFKISLTFSEEIGMEKEVQQLKYVIVSKKVVT